MLNRLLESKANHERSVGGAVASVTAHTALIGLAIYATAQARVEASPPVQVVRPFYVPTPKPSAPVDRTPGIRSNAIRHRLLFVNPAVSVTLAPVDIPLAAIGPADFVRDGIGGAASSGAASAVPDGTYASFRAEQVEKEVSLVPGSASPRYPESLRMAGVQGKVVAQFVVDAEGRVEEGTVRLARSDNPLFDDAVREALARMRFRPAEIAGRKVRQLVEMPFVFALSR